jgi:hypothetical protein
VIKIRLDPEHEMLGCDLSEHFDESDEEVNQHLAVSTATVENIITAMPKNFACPCQQNVSDAANDNLNKRRVFYINKSFEH